MDSMTFIFMIVIAVMIVLIAAGVTQARRGGGRTANPNTLVTPDVSTETFADTSQSANRPQPQHHTAPPVQHMPQHHTAPPVHHTPPPSPPPMHHGG